MRSGLVTARRLRQTCTKNPAHVTTETKETKENSETHESLKGQRGTGNYRVSSASAISAARTLSGRSSTMK